VIRVVGLSSAVLFDKDNPFNPINRRISIIVMNKKAEENAARDGGTVTISEEKQAQPALENGLAPPPAGAPAAPVAPVAPAAPVSAAPPVPAMPPNAATVALQATAAAAAVVARQDAAAVKH
jgi:chemotaxis protein MotB